MSVQLMADGFTELSVHNGKPELGHDVQQDHAYPQVCTNRVVEALEIQLDLPRRHDQTVEVDAGDRPDPGPLDIQRGIRSEQKWTLQGPITIKLPTPVPPSRLSEPKVR